MATIAIDAVMRLSLIHICGVVAQVELVDAERAQEDGQQTGGHVILRRDHRLAVRLLVVRLLIAVVRLLRRQDVYKRQLLWRYRTSTQFVE